MAQIASEFFGSKTIPWRITSLIFTRLVVMNGAPGRVSGPSIIVRHPGLGRELWYATALLAVGRAGTLARAVGRAGQGMSGGQLGPFRSRTRGERR